MENNRRKVRRGQIEAPAVVATPADLEVRRMVENLLLAGERVPFPRRREAGQITTGEGWYPTPVYEEEATPGPFQGEVIPLDVLEGALLLLDLEVREERAPGVAGGFQYEGTRNIPRPLQDEDILGALEALGVEEGLLYYPEEALPLMQGLLDTKEAFAARLLEAGFVQSEDEAAQSAARLAQALEAAIRTLREGPVVGWGLVSSTGQVVAWWGQSER